MTAGSTSQAEAAHPPLADARRRRSSLIVLAASAIVLVIGASAELSGTEVGVFRSINELPQGLNPIVWPFMQYGTFITIPALAVVALVFRRVRLSIALLVAGIGVYVLALLTKQIVERGRPGALLSGVEERETFGEDSLGFPSGHAAVAAALITVVSVHLSLRWTIVALVLGTMVVFGRIYVGAHLPLDVVGGAALGAIAGSLVNLVVGVRHPVLKAG